MGITLTMHDQMTLDRESSGGVRWQPSDLLAAPEVRSEITFLPGYPWSLSRCLTLVVDLWTTSLG